MPDVAGRGVANCNLEVQMNLTKYANKISRIKPRVWKIVSDNRGTLLVYMIVVILIFGVLGVSLVSLFKTSTESSATPNDAKRARFIAESGIRYALSEIRNSDDVETAAELLNTTAEFKLGKNGSFSAGVFSPGLKSAQNKIIFSSGDLTLDVPYSGKFPDDFDVNQAVSNIYIVDWLRFKGTTPPADSYALVTASPDPGGAADVTLDVGDNYDADLGDTISFALLVTDAETNIGRGSSIFVNENARWFLPEQNGAVRIVTLSDGNQYDYFYETREAPSGGKVKLTNVREMPGDTWTNIADMRTGDYVILSPFNFRVFASGKSDQTTVDVGKDRPFWALAVPSEYTIYMRELLQDKSIQQVGDVIRTQEAGDKKIELGKGTSGTEGFGDLWYGGDKSIGGDNSYCDRGRCLFDIGVRVFYTTDVIPGANGGQGFTFALIAGGSLLTPINESSSAGGDFKLPELLGYGGNSRENDTPTYLDGTLTGEGLKPPKMAIEFDTNTNFDSVFNSTLAYCSGSDPVLDSRNDPKPENQLRDVVQYVFWGNDDPTTFDLACRATPESYDDNRHDAEGKEASLNFAFPTGADVRSEPTFDLTKGLIYFGTDDTFYAVDTDTGLEKWLFDGHNGTIFSKTELDTIFGQDYVYFSVTNSSVSNNWIYRLNADTGAPDLEIEVNGRIGDEVSSDKKRVSPAVNNNNNNIYIGSRSAEKFYAYNSSGTLLWGRDLEEDVEASAIIDKTGGINDGNVYVGTADDNAEGSGRVYAFDPVLTPPAVPPRFFTANNDVSSRPALNANGTVVYVVTDLGRLYALDATSGIPATSLWDQDVDNVDWIDPAVWLNGAGADGTIYVATNNGTLHAFTPGGSVKAGWLGGFSLGANVLLSSPTVGPDGTIYIGTTANKVWAINPDKTTKWEFLTGDDVNSTPEIGEDGVVYVGSNDDNLYAIANVALPRNWRNSYVDAGGHRGYLTSANLDTNVDVADPDDWLDGAPLTKGPWAVRTEVKRATSVNANGKFEYTLLTWIRQCDRGDCGDIINTPFQDTTGEYAYSPFHAPDLPLEQVIELTPADHIRFERFLFGFTTAAGATDTQTVEIRDFELTFIQSGDPTIIADPTWVP